MGKKLNLKLVIGLGITVAFFGTLISQEITKKRLSEEKIKVEKELQDLKSKNEDLIKEFDDSQTDEYIERLARERLGMIKEGETAIIVD